MSYDTVKTEREEYPIGVPVPALFLEGGVDRAVISYIRKYFLVLALAFNIYAPTLSVRADGISRPTSRCKRLDHLQA